MLSLVQFPGVEEVLPDGVEAAGDAGDGRHVGVAQPDKEAGVLLAQGLAGSNLVLLVALAEVTAGGKLNGRAGH